MANYLQTRAALLLQKTEKKSTVVTPPLVEKELNATENKTYTAPIGYGYTTVNVDVPTLESDEITITENGEYTAPEGKGYTSVNVEVPAPVVVSKLPSVIDGSVTTLDESNFGNATKIMNSKFINCTLLTSVVIPATVTEIQAKAFQGCTSLASVTLLATTPPTLGSATAFGDTANDLVIYVPAESVTAYKTANTWTNFESKIQAIPAE